MDKLVRESPTAFERSVRETFRFANMTSKLTVIGIAPITLNIIYYPNYCNYYIIYLMFYLKY